MECFLCGNLFVGLFCVFDGYGGEEVAERAREFFSEVFV